MTRAGASECGAELVAALLTRFHLAAATRAEASLNGRIRRRSRCCCGIASGWATTDFHLKLLLHQSGVFRGRAGCALEPSEAQPTDQENHDGNQTDKYGSWNVFFHVPIIRQESCRSQPRRSPTGCRDKKCPCPSNRWIRYRRRLPCNLGARSHVRFRRWRSR